jgi:hypothetical protein
MLNVITLALEPFTAAPDIWSKIMSKCLSQEYLVELEERLEFVSMAIGHARHRQAYLIRQVESPSHLQEAIHRLCSEKAQLLIEIETLHAYLTA